MTRGLQVVVAGAGAAGLEALAALGELAGDRVQLTLLAPDRTFRYRPVSTARPFVPGLPHDRHGFLPVDEHALVRGTKNVWAAGDATSVLLKHSDVGAAQAAAAAESIAAAAGAELEPEPWDPVVHGFLLESSPEFEALAGRMDEPPPTSCLWWSPGRLTGPRLSRLIARRDHRAKPQLGWHPRGLPTAARVQPTYQGAPHWGPLSVQEERPHRQRGESKPPGAPALGA